ncbi:hypothetical protein BVC80_1771g17 [Macleaya cordata]|uniref:LysM domain-containing protein n=1 Tax=Macleaya cordata TaxID=56857 RepID=A0A200QNQ3_MACCD|nr:hypothetical protein BVC80_1771g17 [Macleaya cordata]
MSSNFLLMPSSPSNSNSGSGVNFIEHHVSKMDTLAGVAIKYGVEVADIKRMNGLVTDLQMFALKSLHIPLPGRHPPSSSLSNGSPASGTQHKALLWVSDFQSQSIADGYTRSNPKTPPSRHRKSRSLVNSILTENTNLAEDVPVSEVGDGESEKSNEKSVRRRQKTDADNSPRTPAMLLKVDNSGGSGFSATAGKGLALRPKSTNRLAPVSDSDSGWLKPISVGIGDSLLVNGFGGVRKSSSTSNLQEQDNIGSSFIWATSKWNLPTAAINRPIFDGLPKPVTGRRNKAALD